MGWDNERYPRTKKDTLNLSFIGQGFGISHTRFSDLGISLISHSRFFEFGFWDIPKISQKPEKISLKYLAPAHIPDLSHRYPIGIPKQANLLVS
jgi:hypothetical protein